MSRTTEAEHSLRRVSTLARARHCQPVVMWSDGLWYVRVGAVMAARRELTDAADAVVERVLWLQLMAAVYRRRAKLALVSASC